MNTPQENLALVERARQEVLNHCMCARFSETETHFLVLFPAGDFTTDGVRASKGMGQRAALQKMLQIMERTWLESFP